MKKAIFSLLFAASLSLSAQNYSVPAASPRQSVTQQLSVSNISVDYGRPAVKGREVFGKLVPFNEVWRAGANACTRITFGQDFMFGGKMIKAGTYGLFITPTATEWTVILNTDSTQWGAYTFDAKKNVLEVKVSVQKSAMKQEWFKIELDDLTESSVNLTFSWDMTKASVPIMVAHPAEITKIISQLTEINKVKGDIGKMK
ncbi:DUF2911 domain-containing protein [Halpernia frigidisoli]|uniref:DUF2911 domain-containing protein n=1 Tax=Halpernia frigidisoli TaxID=1125876 RepID=A0A1I3DGG1_9FLAO|nr:DUF2911 domain-containing protein [Halpernia frigidisoli]SFH85733.1 Protein of unknown function [Halpernia frigidisoli]